MSCSKITKNNLIGVNFLFLRNVITFEYRVRCKSLSLNASQEERGVLR